MVRRAALNGLIYVYPDGLNTDFLTMLGFEINPKLTPLVETEGEQVGISAEHLDVLDADVIVFATEKPSDVAALRKVPTFDSLTAVARNRAVYTDGTLAGSHVLVDAPEPAVRGGPAHPAARSRARRQGTAEGDRQLPLARRPRPP